MGVYRRSYYIRGEYTYIGDYVGDYVKAPRGRGAAKPLVGRVSPERKSGACHHSRATLAVLCTGLPRSQWCSTHVILNRLARVSG